MANQVNKHSDDDSDYLAHKRVVIHMSATRTVRRRIDDYSYKAGIMLHTLIENALVHAVEHKFDAREYENDPAIKNFLRPRNGDIMTSLDARVNSDIAIKVEKMAKKQGLERGEFMRIVISYYIIYVLGLVKSNTPAQSTV